MITIVLKPGGGLGNQLFQYAVSRRIADALGEELEIDTRWYSSNKFNYVSKQLWLDKLPIRGFLKRYPEYGPLSPYGLITRARRQVSKVVFKKKTFYEKHFFFDERVLSISKNTTINGFLQSARYLSPFDQALKYELSAGSLLSIEEGRRALSIEQENYISIHVRRGDYLQIPGIPLKGAEKYFINAMELVREILGESKFIVFSDDLEWCRKFQAFRGCDFFDDLTGSPLIDMFMMSKCSHHIISNSTFSWWAAWLGDRPGQVNIAPSEWFDGIYSREAGLIPDHWLTV